MIYGIKSPDLTDQNLAHDIKHDIKVGRYTRNGLAAPTAHVGIPRFGEVCFLEGQPCEINPLLAASLGNVGTTR